MLPPSMLRRALIASFPCAFLFCMVGDARARPDATRVLVDRRTGAEWAWSGRLSAPSRRAPESIARGFVAGILPVGVRPADLALVRTTSLPRGSLVVLEQRAGAAGLRVIGGRVAVRVDAAGRVRWAASGARALPADLALVPSLTEEEATSSAGWIPGLRPGQPRTELVVHAPAGRTARLAYQVTLPFDPSGPTMRRVVVDARTGRVLSRDDLVRRAGQARAFAVNPVETPGTQIVQLAGLDDGATTLTGPDAFAESCVDEDVCVDLGYGPYHYCAFAQTALADANGDFLAYDYVSDTEPEDAFAEVQIFHHAAEAFARARELGGFDGLDQPLRLVANHRTFAPEDKNCDGSTYVGDQELVPFGGAYFSESGEGTDDRPVLVFGQGGVTDFGYDGDVVYHEFGHAVMYQITEDFTYERQDPYGRDLTPGGIHEGYADLMAMFVTGDPEIAEYASMNKGLEVLRDMDNDLTCPAGLVGDGHEDSQVLTGAFWAARQALPEADRPVFDQAVFAAQHAFGASESFVSAAQLTVMEVEASMGASAAAVVAGVFGARGFDDDCTTRVADAAVPHRLLYLIGGYRPEDTPSPSVLQWRLTLDAPADAVQVDIGEMFALGDADTIEADLEVLFKAGDEPILWTEGTQDEERTADYTLSAPFAYTEDAPGRGSARAVIEGPFEPGEYHLQLSGRELVVAGRNLTISAVPSAGAPDAGPSGPDAAVSGPDEDGADGDDEGGCGCRSTAGESNAGGALLFLAALWLGSRRRRPGRRPPRGRSSSLVRLVAVVVVGAFSPACGDNAGWKPLDDGDRDAPAHLGGVGLIESSDAFLQGVDASLHAAASAASSGFGPLLVARDGDCEVWVHPEPFYCEGGCSGGSCVGPDECAPYPERLSAGAITVSGLAEPLRLEPGEYGYQADPAIARTDIFAPGAVIVATAPGDALPGFTLEATGVTPLDPDLPRIRLEDGVDEVVRWTAAGDGRIQLVLQTGWHGRPFDARLSCETDDDGELIIGGDLIATFREVPVYDELQHPSWMARFTRDVVETEAGLVELFVASQEELH